MPGPVPHDTYGYGSLRKWHSRILHEIMVKVTWIKDWMQSNMKCLDTETWEVRYETKLLQITTVPKVSSVYQSLDLRSHALWLRDVSKLSDESPKSTWTSCAPTSVVRIQVGSATCMTFTFASTHSNYVVLDLRDTFKTWQQFVLGGWRASTAQFLVFYSQFTLRKTCCPLRINGQQGFLRVNRL